MESDLKKFYTIVQELDELIGKEEFKEIQPKNLLQGPLSDSMTHIGQIAMLRRIFGSPIPPENFVFANISSNNLSRNQSEPTAPDKKWFDADGKEQKEAL